jgi:hypothetical protein
MTEHAKKRTCSWNATVFTVSMIMAVLFLPKIWMIKNIQDRSYCRKNEALTISSEIPPSN